jgi:electron-transferring-flavoprotein dehydrogenase
MTDNPPPISTPVTSDNFYFLTSEKRSIKIPHFLFPKTIDNTGNYIISLSQLTKWMGEQAQEYGIDIFSGTSGSELLYDEDGSVKGVATGDFGISKKG